MHRDVRPPGQRGERRVEVVGPGSIPYLSVAYRAPSAADDDWWALAVGDTVLSGAKGFNLFGAAPNNRSSRLYRALVDRGYVLLTHSLLLGRR